MNVYTNTFLRACPIETLFIFKTVPGQRSTNKMLLRVLTVTDYRLHAKHSCFNILMRSIFVRQIRLGYQDTI